MRGDVGRGMGGVGKVRGDVRGVKKCGKVSGEVWRVWGSVLDVGEVRRNLGKGMGEWEKVREMWGV